MLFYEDLENIIFTRNQLIECDELLIISGYVGPTPVHKLKDLPLKATVVYGMYGCEGIRQSLHSALLEEKNQIKNLDILYSVIPVHAKCYIWKKKGIVVHALIGSANFSTNGLTTPFKEVLAETTIDTFRPLQYYSNEILKNSINCEEATVKQNKQKTIYTTKDINDFNQEICSLPLYIEKNGKTVPLSSGLNWGLSKLNGSHVNINDAYIKISMENVKRYPLLFPAKSSAPTNVNSVVRKNHRHNDNIEILWDDGTRMVGLLEGSVPKKENGEIVLYPKQISTSPNKSILGKYLRRRLQVKEGEPITMSHLDLYGRSVIDISLQGEGIYFFDFSRPKNH